MAHIITSPSIVSVLENEHLFVDISKTQVELGKIIGRERHIVGSYYRILMRRNPELITEFTYVGSGGETLISKRLSPYICWVLHRMFVMVRITGSRRAAFDYYDNRRDLFSKELFESSLAEALGNV